MAMEHNETKLKWLGESSHNLKLAGGTDTKTSEMNHADSHANAVMDLEKRVADLEHVCETLATMITNEKIQTHQLRSLNFWPFQAADNVSAQQTSSAEAEEELGEELIDGVSMSRINEVVDQLLSKQATNFGWIPDVLERKIDRRLLQVVFGLISQTLTTAAVSIGDGHELRFSLRPAETLRGSDHSGESRTSDNSNNVRNERATTGNLDAVIFSALKNIIGNISVDFLGHELKLHLDE